ncbi:MAG TPA: hypothetical protein VFN78_08900 [Ktedonobacterales bacterium]|nr:hypothetical protein [Ktedonobacterales bacterium]
MTEKAKRHDEDEARENRESLSADLSHELASERDTQRDLTGATTDMTDASEATEHAAAPDAARPRATGRPRAQRTARKATPAQTSAPESTDISALSAIEADRIELEAQGFSPDEAQRLIDISKRLETSAEARASQAELKRLRFAQWLIEHGILDEFSA